MIEMTNAGLGGSSTVSATNEHGEPVDVLLVEERPLTIYLDKQEIVTVMTMGSAPELLVLGYLKNQNLINKLSDIKVIQVDWETAAVAVVTSAEVQDVAAMTRTKVITSGCGQGTMFGSLTDKLDDVKITKRQLKNETIYQILENLSQHNIMYKKAGAVHGCALCTDDEIIYFVEDVGRHNAVDTIAGHMWLNGLSGDQCVFYTTGRLTSEMVIKVAQMNVPVLLSRSGATKMGLDMAQKVGITLISRAKGLRFQVLSGGDNISYSA